ncbi:MAG: thioredoxin fold domain-containing protein [Balneolaceae bacterium]
MHFIKKTGIQLLLLILLASTASCAQETKSNATNLDAKEEESVESEAVNDPSGIEWVSLAEAQTQVKESNKMVLIFGYADWCPYCMQMRKETYTNENVRERLYKYFIPVQLDAESEEELVFNGETFKSWEFAQFVQLASFPTHYFINKDGEIIGAQPGFLPSDVFGPLLSYIGTEKFGEIGFEEYLKETENVVIEQ